MNSIKLLNRWSRIHQLIKQQNTGALRDFATRVGISKSQLSCEIEDMKLMGAPIKYDRVKRTYYYSTEVEFNFGFSEVRKTELK